MWGVKKLGMRDLGSQNRMSTDLIENMEGRDLDLQIESSSKHMSQNHNEMRGKVSQNWMSSDPIGNTDGRDLGLQLEPNSKYMSQNHNGKRGVEPKTWTLEAIHTNYQVGSVMRLVTTKDREICREE
ncbi:hypothetical protein SLE2022_308310 [Rubroshorea leprosula]